MVVVYASVLMVVAVVGLALTLVGLPGNWLIVLAAGIYAYTIQQAGRADIHIAGLVALVALAVLGEILEFAAGAWGAKRAGASRRAAALAIVGSVAGGLVGAVVGLPIPLLGPVLAAVMFASVGALGGALAGELWKGRTWQEGYEVGKGAFRGRLVGTLAKFATGILMVLLLAALLMF